MDLIVFKYLYLSLGELPSHKPWKCPQLAEAAFEWICWIYSQIYKSVLFSCLFPHQKSYSEGETSKDNCQIFSSAEVTPWRWPPPHLWPTACHPLRVPTKMMPSQEQKHQVCMWQCNTGHLTKRKTKNQLIKQGCISCCLQGAHREQFGQF